jgi:hypothetical protein
MNTDCTSVAKLTAAQVRTVLASACSAPSPNGDQPCRFRCTATAIELYADGEHTDDTYPGRVLACGQALLNLRLAVQAMGVYADVRLVPDGGRPGLLAVVRPEHERLATTWDRQLAHAGVRPGSPTVGFATLTPVAALPDLRRAAELEQVWLARLTDAQLDALRMATNGSSLVVVIGSLQDDVRALLRAGQAMQRVALTAVTLGLRTTVLLEPVATPDARGALRTLIGGALEPHAVLEVAAARQG